MIAVLRRNLLPLYLLLAMTAWAGELEKSRQELAEIERHIEQASSELSSTRAAAGSLNDDLHKVERQRTVIETRIAGMQEQEAALSRQTKEQEEEVRRARELVAERKVLVRKRLTALYKSGDMGFLRILFSAEPPARRAERYNYLGRIVRRDRELIAAYRQEVTARETALTRLQELRREQHDLFDDLRDEQQTLKRAEVLKRKVLAKLLQDEQSLNSRLKDLRQGAERLEGLVKKLESAQTEGYTQSAGHFADRKGKLSWPVAGRLISGYGRHRHPDLGTLVDSQGYEIAVAAEASVGAVWPGRVIFANNFPGYGNLLIVDHGEGYYTLYAKGARLAKRVGDRVTAGEVVALAGHGESESLYFEIRHRGTPLDPGDWLTPR